MLAYLISSLHWFTRVMMLIKCNYKTGFRKGWTEKNEAVSKGQSFFVLCLKIRFLKFSIFEFLKNKAKKVKKQSISSCFCHFFEIMGNGENADFYFDLGFSSKHKTFKVFVVFKLCKNRFNIVTSLFSEFDAFPAAQKFEDSSPDFYQLRIVLRSGYLSRFLIFSEVIVFNIRFYFLVFQ